MKEKHMADRVVPPRNDTVCHAFLLSFEVYRSLKLKKHGETRRCAMLFRERLLFIDNGL